MTICTELCKNIPAKFQKSPSKFSAVHPKIALWRNISASHSQNLAGMGECGLIILEVNMISVERPALLLVVQMIEQPGTVESKLERVLLLRFPLQMFTRTFCGISGGPFCCQTGPSFAAGFVSSGLSSCQAKQGKNTKQNKSQLHEVSGSRSRYALSSLEERERGASRESML